MRILRWMFPEKRSGASGVAELVLAYAALFAGLVALYNGGISGWAGFVFFVGVGALSLYRARDILFIPNPKKWERVILLPLSMVSLLAAVVALGLSIAIGDWYGALLAASCLGIFAAWFFYYSGIWTPGFRKDVER